MARKRPTAVTVMGILNIVFGSLSLLCMACLGILMMAMFRSDMLVLPGGVNPVADMWEFMKREVPGYAVVLMIMMLTPTVSAAFAGRSRGSDYEGGERADEADDYERRRRRDGWND